jgi:4-amino-4-deoxy-L-arabinose transferase-like glycosyltransferase
MMKNQQLNKPICTTNWFILFLFIHVAAWTLAPALVRYNLPLDSIEGTLWGHQLEWGYDKNPFMNGWLTALAVYLDGHTGWMIYFFSQLSVAASLTAVWVLGKKIMPPIYALAAVLLLETIQYFNLHAIDFNDNTLELGLWAGAIYFYYQAMTKKTLQAWILTGIMLALGMLAKYYTLALIASLGLFLLRKENRAQLSTWPPYVGFAVFTLMLIPHAIWLTQHEYITIAYMLRRAHSIPHWYNHIYFPAKFIWQQLEVFLPALIIFALLFIGKRPLTATPRPAITAYDKIFLLYAGLGPLVLTVILSFIMGTKLRAGWGMPLMSLWTLLLMVALPPRLSATKMYALIAGIFTFIATIVAVYSTAIINSSDTSSANFPGKEISATLTTLWQNQYHTPVSYVAGSRWIGGNISFYSKERPSVFMEWNPLHSTWINQADFRKKGAIFVWDISEDERLPEAIAKQYPRMTQPVVMQFDWHRNTHHLPPIKLGVAFLPPESE